MGLRGPKPKKKTRGKIVKLVVAVPRCPAKLGVAGKRMWKRVIDGLASRKGVSTLHAESLERACKLADEINVMEKYIATNGWTDSNQNGIEYLRPQVKQLNTARRMIQFYEKEFGLTSASDERIRGLPQQEEESDPLDALRVHKFGESG